MMTAVLLGFFVGSTLSALGYERILDAVCWCLDKVLPADYGDRK